MDIGLVVPTLVAGAMAGELLVLDHPKLFSVVETANIFQ